MFHDGRAGITEAVLAVAFRDLGGDSAHDNDDAHLTAKAHNDNDSTLLKVQPSCSLSNNAKNHPQLWRRAGEGSPWPARPGRLTDSGKLQFNDRISRRLNESRHFPGVPVHFHARQQRVQ